ncbi:MAG: site-specific integrase [Bacteroidetes bacterium]|nr:site-specific integrase [Bacteroidota bacterium]
MRAKASLYLNKYKPNKAGKFPVSIKVTFLRERKYYDLAVSLTLGEFEKKKSKNNTDIAYIEAKLGKALTVIDSLGDNFSFAAFNRMFIKNKALSDSLEAAFDDYIEMMSEDRVGNKEACTDAKRSFLAFRPKARFVEIDVQWLRAYEKWMDSKGRSKTTIGIYMRALRAVFNEAISEGKIAIERYPFGRKKYEIPTGKNQKKALTISEIEKIFSYTPVSQTEEKYRDYWVFLYLCNGLNAADFCRLRTDNIKGETLIFIREKSKRTKREVEPIQIHLAPKAIAIIKKYKSHMLGKNPYLFPHLSEDMGYAQADKTVKNLTRLINEYMKEIAAKLEINKPVTTYYARHSFATILKNSGIPIAMISQMLGHSSILTTQNYLDSFETDQLKKAAAILTDFKSKTA